MSDNLPKSIRPKTFEHFVGQEDAVRQVKVAIISAIKRNDAVPHILMSGPPGLGKTTMAEIISNERGTDFVSAMAAALTNEQSLISLLQKLSRDGYDGPTLVSPESTKPTIVFIDEIHLLKPAVSIHLHSVMEDFVITLKNKEAGSKAISTKSYAVPKFTLVGATNYLGAMPKPLIDRFTVPLAFETYSDKEIERVLRFSSKQLGLTLTDGAVSAIAKRSRGVPRVANNFVIKARDTAVALLGTVGDTLDETVVEESFKIQRIDELGLTRLDRKVLEYLAMAGRPVGLTSVSQGVDDDPETIQNSVEPWLVRLGLMVKTPQGRAVTEVGMKHVGMTSNMGLSPIEKDN